MISDWLATTRRFPSGDQVMSDSDSILQWAKPETWKAFATSSLSKSVGSGVESPAHINRVGEGVGVGEGEGVGVREGIAVKTGEGVKVGVGTLVNVLVASAGAADELHAVHAANNTSTNNSLYMDVL